MDDWNGVDCVLGPGPGPGAAGAAAVSWIIVSALTNKMAGPRCSSDQGAPDSAWSVRVVSAAQRCAAAAKTSLAHRSAPAARPVASLNCAVASASRPAPAFQFASALV